MQPQGFQCFCTSIQQEPHPDHVKEAHITKPDSSKQANHVLQNAHSRERRRRQLSSQRGDEGRNERRISCWFALGLYFVVEELEVLQVPEQPNGVYDLSAGPLRFPQGERVDGW